MMMHILVMPDGLTSVVNACVTVALAPDLDSFRSGLEGVQFPPHCM
jgi:hypothetical protein